ncbi:MAG: DNA polymerase beta domain-containing protein [Candidatus Saganbacteria bacterium]|uniref:DNA polymerase beta domain-containing protein n=1 Tax=Candidatus Saganbacteria bacterium TaxID=2575572 RepID=A0A833L0D1_UNCSA|nr:MAG: DNA polymerase beta domain-containing protein [Candidatus Saganbacteria bacterium]
MNTKPLDTDKLLKMCGQLDISFLGIFGSYARGDFTAKSDLDLLARFSRKKSLLDLVRTERALSDSMGVRVDLLTDKAISPYLREKIMNNLMVIYDSKK